MFLLMGDYMKDKRRENRVTAGLAKTGLYHSFRLPDGRRIEGAMSLDWQEKRLASFRLPADLRGKRVLDIGPWDGYYTFEMERRGAEVTSVDYVDLDTFRMLHRAFDSKAKYLRMDVYELDPKQLGMFDIVLCLGVLYHLKHPLLTLEKICAVCRDVCVVDTFVVDGEDRQRGIDPPLPYAEFYEMAELGGQLDNWTGPTVGAVEAWIRAAGFAWAEVSRVTAESACVLAHRKWKDSPSRVAPALTITAVTSHANRGRSFDSRKEEYIGIWCEWDSDRAPEMESVFPEVDGFGIAPLACAVTPDGLLVNFRLPPGLPPGRHETRLKIGNSGWSAAFELYVDLPGHTGELKIQTLQDSVTWKEGEVHWANGGWMTVWADGLSAEADAGNTVVHVSGLPHFPHAVLATSGQINIQLRPLIEPGVHTVEVIHRGVRSTPSAVRVCGEPPPIRGLEVLTAGLTAG